ncbi:MAG: hypothetical protein Q9160_003288 [Pyrenula sp. 1 TL-2023]
MSAPPASIFDPSPPPPTPQKPPPSSLPPQPAYLPTTPQSSSLLHPPPPLLTLLHTTPRSHPPLHTHLLPPRTGHAFPLPRHSILRISLPQGPQVVDMNLWSLSNPRERFWASRTRQLHASHVSVGDRLWSCLPYMRPMVTIVGDTLADKAWGVGDGDGDGDVNGEGKGKGGKSIHGGRVHDLLGTRCDPYVNALLSSGAQSDTHCHSNLLRAILPFNLTEHDIHDVINLFQVTGLDGQGRYFMEPCPAEKGEYVEFFAEMDCLVAVSACPGGDLRGWGFGHTDGDGDGGGNGEGKGGCREVRVEAWELEDREGVEKELREGEWMEGVSGGGYRGGHGLRWKEREMQEGERKEKGKGSEG